MECITTPAGWPVCIIPPTVFLPAAALTPPTATQKTSATQPQPRARSSTRSVWCFSISLTFCCLSAIKPMNARLICCPHPPPSSIPQQMSQIISQIPILPLTCTYNMSLYPVQTNLPPVFQGCYELVTSFMETNMAIIAGVTFGIAFSQVTVPKRAFLCRTNKRWLVCCEV